MTEIINTIVKNDSTTATLTRELERKFDTK